MSGDTVELTISNSYQTVTRIWSIKNWGWSSPMLVAAEASLHVEVGDPKVALRFFLRSKEKFYEAAQVSNGKRILTRWYSLCAEVLTQLNENAVIQVVASADSDGKNWASESGTIPLNKSKGKIVEVIDPFIFYEYRVVDSYGQVGIFINHTNDSTFRMTKCVSDMNISVTAEIFRLADTGCNNATPPVVDTETNSSVQAEGSLTDDLKNMFVEHENYSDLKLQSKDHMTLDAHKFILAARSRYLRKCIDDAMKTENFDGTVKMNINGKPLVAILHWMYTGELHENAGSVMEEVVDAAVLFELIHLMKLLDRKVITICNKENMFRLYQVAQKNGMPNAMDDVSAYIREHLK